MKRARVFVLAVAMTISGCTIHAVGPTGYTDRKVPDIRIITAAEASTHDLESEPYSLEFGAGTDGSGLITRFLRAARQRGATHVSGLEIHLVSNRDGRPVQCTTRIAPKHHLRTRMEQRWTPSRMQSHMVVRPVTRTVTEMQNECRTVMRPVTRTETYTTQQYDSFSRSSRSVTRTRLVTRNESRQECRMVPRTRTVTRMEHQWENRYVPPRMETISRRYSQWELGEGAPECSAIEPGNARRNRITGTLHRKRAPAAKATATARR